MNFAEADNSGGLPIRAYEPGRIRVADTDYRAHLIVTPARVLPDWTVPAVQALQPEDLAPVLALEPEIVLLGTGATQCFPSPEVMAAVLGRGIGLEVMDTGAACRTYNILMSEGRRVVAALIML